MPKLVKELPQGKAFGRSSEGGVLADTATRVWKIILNAPNEGFDISQAIGVQIGDPLDSVNQIPCVSIDVKSDGESRLVRIVTAQYRSSAMVDGEGGTGLPDPMLIQPDLRPANFSTSTSLYEMPAAKWKTYGSSEWTPCLNPAKDRVEGIVKMEPITTIRIQQFNYFPGTIYANRAGYINTAAMSLGGYANYEPHTVMFRGVEAQPHVETFGNMTHRGFMNAYEFAYRQNWVFGFGACGWDQLVILEGYNCITTTPNLVSTTLDNYAMPLERIDGGGFVTPLKLAKDVSNGMKVRAHVLVTTGEYAGQNPSAMPIALNEDGTPRNLTGSLEPVMKRKQIQPDVDLVNELQLRIG